MVARIVGRDVDALRARERFGRPLRAFVGRGVDRGDPRVGEGRAQRLGPRDAGRREFGIPAAVLDRLSVADDVDDGPEAAGDRDGVVAATPNPPLATPAV